MNTVNSNKKCLNLVKANKDSLDRAIIIIPLKISFSHHKTKTQWIRVMVLPSNRFNSVSIELIHIKLRIISKKSTQIWIFYSMISINLVSPLTSYKTLTEIVLISLNQNKRWEIRLSPKILYKIGYRLDKLKLEVVLVEVSVIHNNILIYIIINQLFKDLIEFLVVHQSYQLL